MAGEELPPVIANLVADPGPWIEGLRAAQNSMAEFSAAVDGESTEVDASLTGVDESGVRLGEVSTASADEAAASYARAAAEISASSDEIKASLDSQASTQKLAGTAADESATEQSAAADRNAESDKRSGAAAEESAGVQSEAADKNETSDARSGAAAEGMSSKTKMAMLATAAVVLYAGYKSVESAETFQSSMASIRGSAQLTSTQAKDLGSAWLDTAGKTTFSADAIASAFAPVAGVVRQVAGGMLTARSATLFTQAAMDAAEASGQDLGTTMSDLSTTMLAYGIGTKGAAGASNELFNIARETGVTIDKVSTSVDKLHAKLGVLAPSLSDVGTLVVDLAQHGITGSRGLMIVNTAMSHLVTQASMTKTQIGALTGASLINYNQFKDLGIRVFDTGGKFVGMRDVLAQLEPKLADMTDKQRLSTLGMLFGASAASSLNKTIMAGVSGYDKASAAVTTQNAVQKAAAMQADTLHGQVKTLEATFDDLAVHLGTVLIPAVTDVAHVFVGITNFFEQNKAAAVGLAVVVGVALTAAFAHFGAEAVSSFRKDAGSIDSGIEKIGKWIAAKQTQAVQGATSNAQIAGSADATAAQVGAADGEMDASAVAVGTTAEETAVRYDTAMVGIGDASEIAAGKVVASGTEMDTALGSEGLAGSAAGAGEGIAALGTGGLAAEGGLAAAGAASIGIVAPLALAVGAVGGLVIGLDVMDKHIGRAKDGMHQLKLASGESSEEEGRFGGSLVRATDVVKDSVNPLLKLQESYLTLAGQQISSANTTDLSTLRMTLATAYLKSHSLTDMAEYQIAIDSTTYAGAEKKLDRYKAEVKTHLDAIIALAPGLASQARSGGVNIGNSLAEGMASGIEEQSSQVAASSANMVRSAEIAARAATKPGSPSRLFADIGLNMAAGMALGLESGMGVVGSAAENLVRGAAGHSASLGGLGAGAGAAGGGGGGTTNNVNIYVAAGAGADSRALAQQIANEVKVALLQGARGTGTVLGRY